MGCRAIWSPASRVGAVALRREDLSIEELERQRALDRSWAAAQRALADPVVRSRLEQSISELDAEGQSPMLSSDEFLALTQPVE